MNTFLLDVAKALADMTATELRQACTCDGDEYGCEACFAIGAMDAGIPRSVVFGRTKLSDHFSPSYIKAQARQPDCDICSDCKEHCSFDDDGASECCGAGAYETDPDVDMER